MKFYPQFYSTRIRTILFYLILVMPILGGASYAQDYPIKALRIVVPFPPGGSTDLAARIVGEKLSAITKQTVLIENKAGANGGIGAEIVARAAPDGYTILLGNLGIMAINPAIYERLSYDPRKQFVPVAMNVVSPLILIAHPSAGIHNVADLIARAKSEPGKLTFASGGNGSAAHLAAELLNYTTGIQTLHVPYKGAAAVNDVLSGNQGMFMFGTIPSVIQFVRAGRLRGLAVTSLKRSASAPDIPTMAESGYPEFEASSWFGLLGPADMPRDIANKLHAEVVRILKIPEIRDKLSQQGADPVGNSPEEFAAYIRAETTKWAKVVKASGAKAE